MKVSIILPAYNRAHTISRAIKSILEQSYENFELLCIDNGSIDDTRNVVKAIGDKRLKYFYYDERKGAGAARNYGITLAKGELIAFMDSDDEWLEDKLDKQVRILSKNKKIDLVYSDMWWVPLSREPMYHVAPDVSSADIINADTHFYQVYLIGIQSIIVKRECLEGAGKFREDMSCFEDMEFLIRLQQTGYKFYRVNKPLVKYYETPGSVSTQIKEEIVVRGMLVKVYKSALLKHRAFYLREKIIVALCKYFDLAEYFSKGNRLSFIDWIKGDSSPYAAWIRNKWISITNKLFEKPLRHFGTEFIVTDAVVGAEVVISLAPPNSNRLIESLNQYRRTGAERIFVLTSSQDSKFCEGTPQPLIDEINLMASHGIVEFVYNEPSTRPSTLTEIQKLRDLLIAYSKAVLVTDSFHTRRTRMVVDMVFREDQDKIHICDAENKVLSADGWWHSYSGIRTYVREWMKQWYYKYYLLRKLS